MTQTQAPCGGGLVINGGTANGGNCTSIPFRTLTQPQKGAIRAFVDSLPSSILITVASIYGSADGDAYAGEFMPLFDGHHLDNQTIPSLKTGFPKSFAGVFVATTTDDDPASVYRNSFVDVLVGIGIPAHRANGSKVNSGSIEFLIGYRPEEVSIVSQPSSVQVSSQGQIGGVTAGTIGTVIQGSPANQEAENRRREIQERLASLIVEGNRQKTAWQAVLRTDEATQRKAAEPILAWHSSVANYLSTIPRGIVYRAKFETELPSNGTYPIGIFLAIGGLWDRLSSDLTRLNEITNDADLGK